MSNTTTLLAWAALLVFGCALFALGAQWPAFSHAQHPVAFAGMRGVEGAWLFNAMVFVLPGAMLSLVALRLRGALPAGARWQPRVGATLLLLSALAFAAQGMLPLDPEQMDAGSSRWHAAAWMVWWIAFAVGALLYARATLAEHLVAVAAVLLVLATTLLARDWLPAGIAQRMAFVAWFAWFGHAAWRMRR
jgi:hypothetical protein